MRLIIESLKTVIAEATKTSAGARQATASGEISDAKNKEFRSEMAKKAMRAYQAIRAGKIPSERTHNRDAAVTRAREIALAPTHVDNSDRAYGDRTQPPPFAPRTKK